MTEPLQIVELTQTTDFCPAQWDGKTADGRQVYIRYRCGRLRVYTGKVGDFGPMAAVNGSLEFLTNIGGPFDGYMTSDQLVDACGDVIRFPETIRSEL